MKKNIKRLLWGITMWLCMGTCMLAAEQTLTVSVGIEGLYKSDRYAPINITIANSGNDLTGTIRINQEYSDTEYLQKIDLPKGTTKKMMVPIYLSENDGSNVKVELLDKNDHILSEEKLDLWWNSLNMFDLAIGVMTESDYKLNYFSNIDIRLNESFQTQSFPIEANQIDENIRNIDLLDVLVINNYNTSSLLPEQIQSIKAWVEQGGELIIGTGDNGKKCLSGFDDTFLPVQLGNTYQETMNISGQDLTLECAELNVNTPYLQHKSSSLYRKLYETFNYGNGKIIIMKYDLGLEPMLHFSGNKEVWKRIFMDEVQVENAYTYNNYWTIEEELSSISNHKLLGSGKLWLVLGIYIGILGIGSYFILKRLKKKEWIWGVAPGIAITMTFLVYLLAMPSRLAPYIINQLDMAYTDQFGATQKSSFISVINSHGDDLNIVEPEGIYFKNLSDSHYYGYRYGYDYEGEKNKKVSFENGKMHCKLENRSIYDSTFLMSTSQVAEASPYADQFNTNLYTEGSFTFTNTSDKMIERLLFLRNNNVYDFGSVQPGQTVSEHIDNTYGQNLWELSSRARDQGQTELASVLTMLDDWYNNYNAYNRLSYNDEGVFLTITKKEDVLPIIEEKVVSEFNYKVSVFEVRENEADANDVYYPYDYFRPSVENQTGLGYVDDSTPVSTLNGDITVDLVYYIATDCEIESVELGMNDVGMQQYYYNSLAGDILIFNYQTSKFESIKDDLSLGTIEIMEGKLEDCMKEGKLRIRVIGENEDCGLLPSIAVRGTNYVND